VKREKKRKDDLHQPPISGGNVFFVFAANGRRGWKKKRGALFLILRKEGRKIFLNCID